MKNLKQKIQELSYNITTEAGEKLIVVEIDDVIKLIDELSNINACNLAKKREEACRVREQVAINFMLETWCNVEVTDTLKKHAFEEFKSRYVN